MSMRKMSILVARCASGLLLQSRARHSWNYKEGSTIFIDMATVRKCSLEISSAWVEDCSIAGRSAQDTVLMQCRDTATVQPTDRCGDDMDLALIIPERSNLSIRGKELNVSFKKKFLGDLTVLCDSGSIHIDKYRGEKIRIQAKTADIRVSTALEGGVHISGGRVSIQMIHSNQAVIHGNQSVDINAAYSKSLEVTSNGNVHVGMMQGNCLIRASGDVTIPKLIGSIDASSSLSDARIYIDELTANSVSSINAAGIADVKVNPKVSALLKCCAREASESGDKNDNLDLMKLINFDGNCKANSAATEGVLRGGRGDSLYADKFTSGKINVKNDPKGKGYVDAQAFFAKLHHNNSSSKASVVEGQATRNQAVPITINSSVATAEGQSLTVTAGIIRMSSKSWIDELKAKHGVSEDMK